MPKRSDEYLKTICHMGPALLDPEDWEQVEEYNRRAVKGETGMGPALLSDQPVEYLSVVDARRAREKAAPAISPAPAGPVPVVADGVRRPRKPVA